MDIHSKTVMTYRWVTFLLAGGYCLYRLLDSDYSNPGGPFRFLTIWALFFSFYSASRMLALSERRITRRHHNTAAVTAVLNIMVVFLYWRLFFTDPALVNGNGDIPWHQQYYLHLLGPALQVFDALFIARVFRKPLKAIPALLGVVILYITWTELFVQRFNTHPSGSVTSGLPYPFLNNMEWGDRVTYYGVNLVVAVGILMALAAIGWLLRPRKPVEPDAEPATQ